MTKHVNARKPRIRMIDSEADRIADLALAAEARMPELCGQLLSEIERAQTARDGAVGDDVVTMGAHVTYSDEASGQSRTVQLVYPGEANIEAGRVSILTPIGAALIGLSVGQSIVWPDRNGKERALTILAVKRD